MKKSLLKILSAGAILLSTTTATFANTTSIGLVDTQKIIENSTLYSELRKAEADLLKLQKNFEPKQMKLLRLKMALNKALQVKLLKFQKEN